MTRASSLKLTTSQQQVPAPCPACEDLSDGRGATPAEGDAGKPQEQVSSRAAGEKLLFVLPKSANFGGLERHLLDLLARLGDDTLRVEILCFDQDIISHRLEPELRTRVAVRCINEPKTLGGWRREIRKSRPDRIVFCYSWLEAFPWQAPLAAVLAGVPKRYSIQHLISTPPPPRVRGRSPIKVLRRLFGERTRYMAGVAATGYLSSQTICVSDAVRNALLSNYRFPASKTVTVRNGVSTASFFPSPKDGEAVRLRLGIRPEEFLLVCAARLSEAKGIDILLQAVAQVLQKGVCCKCVIIGTGSLKEKLQQQANSLGIAGQVFFEGFQKNVLPYLQAGTVFILTSHLEGLPLSALEAMACGLPCIVTDVGGSAEAVAHQEVGLVIPPANVDAAAEAILYLAAHPEERARMAGKTRQRVCEFFDIETSMGAIRRLLLN